MTDDMKPRKLNILVLFAGAGLATRGLLDAGHSCTDVEIDPAKSHLSRLLNPEAKHIVSDVRDLDSKYIASFDAVWASPPCQKRSDTNHNDLADAKYQHHDDLLNWALELPNSILWVENVISRTSRHSNKWGRRWNAAQFEHNPRMMRRRLIGGCHRAPFSWRPYQDTYSYPHICPTPLASELGHGGMRKDRDKERRKFTRFYVEQVGRVPAIPDMAFRMGVNVPYKWYRPLGGFTERQWIMQLSEAIGNGVPVYMARAFGEAYSKPVRVIPMRQLELAI